MDAKAALFPAVSSFSIFDTHYKRKRYFVSVRRRCLFIFFTDEIKDIIKGEDKGNESEIKDG